MAHAPTTTDQAPRAPLTLHGQSVEGVDRCVHCGLCLAYCPTFSELGTEMDSPRGRILLIKSLAEGRIALTDSATAHLDLCLGCRACETVCPSGVPYGQLIETARAEIERQRPGGPLRRLFRWVNFSLLLPSPRLLRLAAAGLRFYQASGLQRLVRGSGLLGLLPASLRHWEPLLPDLPARGGPRAAARGDAGRGRAARAGGPAHRLHPAGGLRPAQPRDRAGPGAQRPRGDRPARAGLLRGAARARGRARHRARAGPAHHRGLRARPGRAGGGQHLGLRRAHEVVRHAAGRRSRVARPRRALRGARARRLGDSSPSSRCAGRCGRSRAPSPITIPVTSCTARRSAPSPARSWPRFPGCAWWSSRRPTGAAARPGRTT